MYSKLIIFTILILFIYNINCKVTLQIGASTELIFSPSALSFSNIVTPYTNDNRIINTPFVATPNITLTKPSEQELPATILGMNIPMGTSYLNDPTLMEFLGNQSGYGQMLAHYNCKGGKPSCQEFRFPSEVKDLCLMVGGVDGFDHVTIESSLNGESVNMGGMGSWQSIANGSFSNSVPSCPNMMQRNAEDKISLGCFEHLCDNPNFNILMPNSSFDYLKVCYSSYSQSENVFYAINQCQLKEIIKPTPPGEPLYAITGIAFVDVDGDGRYTLGSDTPISGINVTLLNALSNRRVTNPLTGLTIDDSITDSTGRFVVQGFRSNLYTVTYRFDSTKYKNTIQSTQQGTVGTSKINANFVSGRLTVTNVSPGVRNATPNDQVGNYVMKVLDNINGGVVPVESSSSNNV